MILRLLVVKRGTSSRSFSVTRMTSNLSFSTMRNRHRDSISTDDGCAQPDSLLRLVFGGEVPAAQPPSMPTTEAINTDEAVSSGALALARASRREDDGWRVVYDGLSAHIRHSNRGCDT